MQPFLLIAPITPEHPIDLGESGISSWGEDLSFQRMPSWIQTVAAPLASLDSGFRELSGAPYAFFIEIPDACQLESASGTISSAQLAGWMLHYDLTSPRHFLFSMETTGPRVHSWTDAPRIYLDPLSNQLDPEGLEKLHNLFRILVDLPEGTALWRAVDALDAALEQRRASIRFVLFWTVLEALFGPDGSGATTHSLCERIARFSKTDRDGILERYKQAKKWYGFRSNTVHGSGMTMDDSALLDLESMTREELIRILESAVFRNRFSSPDRDRWLREMVLVGL